MNLVVDTNIVFSALLNPTSVIGEMLMNVQDEITFYAPELLKEEVEHYSDKISQYSKLDTEAIKVIKSLVFNTIHFISEDLISEHSWHSAIELVKDIDEFDAPFVALSIELSARLWSGDKKLTKGLLAKQQHIIITTEELYKIANME
jgi:predicted nucleic acid-binding protein